MLRSHEKKLQKNEPIVRAATPLLAQLSVLDPFLEKFQDATREFANEMTVFTSQNPRIAL
jgi:hypothetical protein